MATALELTSVEVGAQRLRVGRWPGTGGTPLLVFNGIGANIELLEPFVEALDSVEVLTFDVPGTGGSPLPVAPYRFSTLARLAARLLDTLGYGTVDVLGVSWGGALAQQFAHQYRSRCRRLVLAATSPGALMVPGRPSTMLKLLSPRRYRDPEYLESVGAEIYGGAYRRDPGLLRVHGGQIRPPGGLGYSYQLMAAWGWTSALWLRTLPQPALVMHGTDDPIVPLVNAKLLAALLRDARLHVVDDGHLFMLTRAADTAAVVRGFLAAERA
jgi:poly(3-hydroxyalkanoate) depolymerase